MTKMQTSYPLKKEEAPSFSSSTRINKSAQKVSIKERMFIVPLGITIELY